MRAFHLVVAGLAYTTGRRHRERMAAVVRHQDHNRLNRLHHTGEIEAASPLWVIARLLLAFSNPLIGEHATRPTRLCSTAQLLCRSSLAPLMRNAIAEDKAVAVEAAFEEAVRLCELKQQSDAPLSAEVFDADFEWLLSGEVVKQVQNVSCMQPADGPTYGVADADLLELPLRPGRLCRGGECCSACSRVVMRGLATRDECDSLLKELNGTWLDPKQHRQQLDLNRIGAETSMRAALIFLRLVERVRRAVAHEYGLDLSRVAPCNTQVYARRRGTFLGVHADESAFDYVHYSATLYLNTRRVDFLGGGLAFVNKDREGGGVRLEPPGISQFKGDVKIEELDPERGMLVFFSTGWENIHIVQPVYDGCRIAIPMFFSTNEVEIPASTLSEDGVMADALWHNLLNCEVISDFKEFQSQWPYSVAGLGHDS